MMSRTIPNLGTYRRNNNSDAGSRNTMQQRRRSNRIIRPRESSDSEEEPWDQRKRDGERDNNPVNSNNLQTRVVITSEQQNLRHQQSVALRVRIVDDDGELDDGDLPSLSNYRPTVVSPPTTGIRPILPASTASSAGTPISQLTMASLVTSIITPSPSESVRKVWNRPESETDGIREPRFNTNKINTSGYVEEESGPHDETEARRAGSYRTKKKKKSRGGKSKAVYNVNKNKSEDESTDYAVSRADTYESDSYDEEDEDEVDGYCKPPKANDAEDEYDHTFCGQTLTALNDFCGGRLSISASNALTKKSTDEAGTGINKKQTSMNGDSLIVPNAAEESHSSKQQTESRPQDMDSHELQLQRMASEDTQQENTAIEVEFVEATVPSAKLDRKNALLDAFAKKAKDDFEDSQKKKLAKSDNAENAGSTKETSLERTIPLQKTISEAISETSVKSEDDVYNRMTVAEKRKFLSYINYGSSPYEATKKVIKDRTKKARARALTIREKGGDETTRSIVLASKQQQTTLSTRASTATTTNVPLFPADAKARLTKKAKENARRFSFWKRGSKSNDSDESGNISGDSPTKTSGKTFVVNKVDIDSTTPKREVMGPIREIQVNEGEDLHFQKFGSLYYDATTREQKQDEDDDNDDHDHSDPDQDSSFLSRSSDRSKKRQFPGVLPLRPKGFEALKDKDVSEAPFKKNYPVEVGESNVVASATRENQGSNTNRKGPEDTVDEVAVRTGKPAAPVDTKKKEELIEMDHSAHTLTEQNLINDQELGKTGGLVTQQSSTSQKRHLLEDNDNVDGFQHTGEDVSDHTRAISERQVNYKKLHVDDASSERKQEDYDNDGNADPLFIPDLQSAREFSKKRQFPKGFEDLKNNDVTETKLKANHPVEEEVDFTGTVIESDSGVDHEYNHGDRKYTENTVALRTGTITTPVDTEKRDKISETDNKSPTLRTRNLVNIPEAGKLLGLKTQHASPSQRRHLLEDSEIADEGPLTGKDVSYNTRSNEVSCEDSTRLSTGSNEGQSRGSEPSDLKTEGSKNLDMSIDAYFNSTANIVKPSKPVSRDGMSVYTLGTTVTAGSTYSQSSRVRRPGAAKARLAKQKEVENKVGKKNGWHASIKAAAASNNRAWDPRKGWVDYHDPDIDALPETSGDSSNDKIHIALDRSVLSTKVNNTVESSVSPDRGVDIPFPSEWEQERIDMLDDSSVVEASRNNDATRNSVSVNKHVPREDDSVSTQASNPDMSMENRPNGWLESMKAASAALASKGVKWDPVHGWTKHSEDEQIQIDDTIGLSRGATSIQNSEEEFSRETFTSETRYDETNDESNSLPQHTESSVEMKSLPPKQEPSEIYDEMTSLSPNEEPSGSYEEMRSLSPNQKPAEIYDEMTSQSPNEEPRGSYEEMKSLPPNQTPRGTYDEMTSRRSNQVYDVDDERLVNERDDFDAILAPKPAKVNPMQMIEEKEGFAMIQVAADSTSEPKRMKSYDLLGRGSFDNNNGIKQEVTRKSSPTFGFADDIRQSTAIEVVKEKVNFEDMELFGESKEDYRSGNSSPGVNVSRSVVSAESSRDSSFRRSGGPIDVDEVDETWDSDDSQRRSRGWETDSKSVFDASVDTRHSGSYHHSNEDHIKDWKSREQSPAQNRVDSRARNTNKTVDSSTTENNSGRSKVASRYSINLGTDSRSVYSTSTRGSARSSLNKKVPKLERSKRDTSPISISRVIREKSFGSSPVLRVDNERLKEGELSSIVIDEKKCDSQQRDVSYSSELDTTQYSNLLNGGGAEERKSSTGTEADPVEDKYTYSPDDHRQRTKDEKDDVGIPTVKDRLQEWESRIEKTSSIDNEDEFGQQNVVQSPSRSTGSEEWKSFLSKKVTAEMEAAKKHNREEVSIAASNPSSKKVLVGNSMQSTGMEEDDSLFAFRESEVNPTTPKRYTMQPSLDDISDLSPIQHKEANSDSDRSVSEAYGPTEKERGISSFFQRLSACAAPVLPQTSTTASGSVLQNSHFDFLRSIPQSEAAKMASDFVTNSLKCGSTSPDDKDESQMTFESEQEESLANSSFNTEREKTKPTSSSRSKHSFAAGRTSSSVVSEDFGAKTAYLEALATRAAVSNPKRNGSRHRERASGTSSVASGVTESSEKWKAFLERKRGTGTRTFDNKSTSTSVSRAAEKYAAEKVEEMMMKMAQRSKSAPKSLQNHSEIDKMLDTSEELYGSTSTGELKIARKKGSAVKAAEDLAAARVEAMMAALSTDHLDEGEI